MIIKNTGFKDLLIIEPTLHVDDRGYFFESFNKNKFNRKIGKNVKFVQDNESYSKLGVLRGLHLQKQEFAQAKLVRVVEGVVLDIVVDLRKHEPTYKKWFSIELSGVNKKQLFVPRGFAHGFVTLSPEARFLYKCDNVYSADNELCIKFNDPVLNIEWKIKEDKLKISSKDLNGQSLKEVLEQL